MNIKSLYAIIIMMLMLPLIFTSFTNADDKSTSDPSPVQVKLDAAVETILKETSIKAGKVIPTLSVFIDTPFGYWFSSSAGEGYQAITADTYFRFASNTKNFTAAAVLKMQEFGWLNMNDNIVAMIPEMAEPYVPTTNEWNIPYKDQISIKMLLQHSAGVYDVDNDSVPGFGGKTYTEYIQDMDPDHQFTVTEMVNQIVMNNLEYFPPGTDYHYSNTGYAIIGEIVSRIYTLRTGSQKTLTDFLHTYLYGPESKVPLDIHFPYLASDQDLPSPYSCGYMLYSPTNTEEFCRYNMSAQVAEGNGYTTLRNLKTYIRTLMRGENFLSPASVEIMKTDVSTANPHYGLGCTHTVNLGYGHNGARIGNISSMMYDPDHDVTVVSYINAFDNDDITITLQAVRDVAYAARVAAGYSGKP